MTQPAITPPTPSPIPQQVVSFPSSGKRKVVLVILSKDGLIEAPYLVFRTKLQELSANPNHPFLYDIGVVRGVSPAVRAHNFAVKIFQQQKGDFLWIWADDMTPTVSSIKVMELADKADIVHLSVYNWIRKLGGRMMLLAGVKGSGYDFEVLNVHPSSEPYEIDAVGTGGTLINRKVFDDPRMLVHPEQGPEDPAVYFQDIYTPSMRRLMGHDFDFTWRAKKLGYKVMVHPGANADHRKSIQCNEIVRHLNYLLQVYEAQKEEGFDLDSEPDQNAFREAVRKTTKAVTEEEQSS